jgi:hypothetical protein
MEVSGGIFEGFLLSVCGRHCGLFAPIASCSNDESKSRGRRPEKNEDASDA